MAISHHFVGVHTFIKPGGPQCQDQTVGRFQSFDGITKGVIDVGQSLLSVNIGKRSMMIETLVQSFVNNQFVGFVGLVRQQAIDGLLDGNRVVQDTKGIDNGTKTTFTQALTSLLGKAGTHDKQPMGMCQGKRCLGYRQIGSEIHEGQNYKIIWMGT